MEHWKPIELFYVAVVLTGIQVVWAAAIAAGVMPWLQARGVIHFPILSAARKTGTRQHRLLVLTQTLLVILSAGTLLCLIDGFFIEPFHLTINKLEIQTPKLKSTRFRIVQLSDLHCYKEVRLEPRIAASVAQLHPDVILFCGDAANSPQGLPNFKQLLKSFADVAPTYVAKGDWDFSFTPALDYFSGTGAHELYNRPAKIEKNGEFIWIGGTATGAFGLVNEVLSLVPPDVFTVFAYHEPNPDMFPANANVDLFLVGHTHGGQVVFPGVGALVTRSQYGRRFVSGLFHIGRMQMYVNRGIGMEGHFLRVRFLCPPEIAVSDIVTSDERRRGTVAQ